MLLTKEVDQLSADQLRLLEETRTHWGDVGLSTAEVNTNEALSGIKLAYEAAGLKLPGIIISLKSPRAGATAVRLLKSDLEWPAQLDPSQKAVWDDVWKQCIRQIEQKIGIDKWAAVRRDIRKEAERIVLDKESIYIESRVKAEFAYRMGIWIWKYLRQISGEPKFQQIRTEVEASVNEKVREQVSHKVLEEVFQELVPAIRRQVWASIGEPTRTMITTNNGILAGRQTWECGFGHLDSSWIAYYDFLRAMGVDCTTPLNGIKKLTESCGWWWPYEGLCILTGRPVEVHRDNRGIIHNETGMAIKYSDGWGYYAWHGIIVPEYVVLLPEPIDVEMINNEPNAEVRRVLIERFGLDNYLKAGNVLKVHQDETGILYRMNLRGDEPILVVRVMNSTPEPDGTIKEYFLRVPPNMLRARQAVAWTFGLTEEEYFPLAET